MIVFTFKFCRKSSKKCDSNVSTYDDNAIPKPPSDFLMKSNLKPPKRRAPINKLNHNVITSSAINSPVPGNDSNNKNKKVTFKIREYGPEFIV